MAGDLKIPDSPSELSYIPEALRPALATILGKLTPLSTADELAEIISEADALLSTNEQVNKEAVLEPLIEKLKSVLIDAPDL